MRGWDHICFALAFIFASCGKTDTYSHAAKTTDSLSGAISSLVKELEKTDTLLLQKAIARYADYKLFIQQNINDTIQKTEADNLQHFYAGGESLENFALNRKTVLERARLIGSQLTRLSEDIKTGSPEPNELTLLVSREKEEAGKLMETGHEQQKKFQVGFEELKNALPGVELLIRSRNRGELPTIIKDTLNF